MLKKIALWAGALVVVLGGSVLLFPKQVRNTVEAQLTRDMWINETDAQLDVGLQVGTRFPAIRVAYNGQVYQDLSAFMGDKGLVFIAVRSASW